MWVYCVENLSCNRENCIHDIHKHISFIFKVSIKFSLAPVQWGEGYPSLESQVFQGRGYPVSCPKLSSGRGGGTQVLGRGYPYLSPTPPSSQEQDWVPPFPDQERDTPPPPGQHMTWTGYAGGTPLVVT